MRIGIDLGGTKIEGIVIDEQGKTLCRERIPTPRNDYPALLVAVNQLVDTLQAQCGFSSDTAIGFGTPGALDNNGLIKNSNSVCLNHQPFLADLEQQLARPIRITNDANCFALSEAIHGAGKDAGSVFGIILGTGTGGGLVINKQIIQGKNRIAGEWGHNCMPGLGQQFDNEQRRCYCGRLNCIETYLCGEGLAKTYLKHSGQQLIGPEIAALAEQGDTLAAKSIDDWARQLAYASAQVINIVDPDVIVLGGGLSNISKVYQLVPEYWPEFVFSDTIQTRLAKAEHGDSSGVYGAAWLW